MHAEALEDEDGGREDEEGDCAIKTFDPSLVSERFPLRYHHDLLLLLLNAIDHCDKMISVEPKYTYPQS